MSQPLKIYLALNESMAALISSLTRWNSDQGLPAGSSNPQCSFFTLGGNTGQFDQHHYIELLLNQIGLV